MCMKREHSGVLLTNYRKPNVEILRRHVVRLIVARRETKREEEEKKCEPKKATRKTQDVRPLGGH
jgi:hypothetical protein